MKIVTGKQIIEHAQSQLETHLALTSEQLSQTVGGLNGMDMETYNKGYTDALCQLISFFETRV